MDKLTQQDLRVTPYLQVINFTQTLVDTSLTVTCQVKATRIAGMPNLYEIKGHILNILSNSSEREPKKFPVFFLS